MATALVVAAGSGERLGASVPKAFVVLAGKPMIEWSIESLAQVPEIDRVVVAAPPGHSHGLDVTTVAGGATRSESVRNALMAAGEDVGSVVVHDAARPLAPPELFSRCLAALADADAAIAAAPVTDTVKVSDDGVRVLETLDRSRLWAVQTPQAFRASVLRAVLSGPDEVLARATDDASLVEAAGGRVELVESTARNFKVTTPHDLRVAELLLGG